MRAQDQESIALLCSEGVLRDFNFLFSGCSGRVVNRNNQGSGEARHRQLIKLQRLRGQPRRCSCALRLVTLFIIQSVLLCALTGTRWAESSWDRAEKRKKKKFPRIQSLESYQILSRGKCGPRRAGQNTNNRWNVIFFYIFRSVLTKQRPQTPRSVFYFGESTPSAPPKPFFTATSSLTGSGMTFNFNVPYTP